MDDKRYTMDEIHDRCSMNRAPAVARTARKSRKTDGYFPRRDEPNWRCVAAPVGAGRPGCMWSRQLWVTE